MTTHKEALEAAYLAGFNASGEGYNGEYPFGDRMQDPAENRAWKKDRDNYIKEALMSFQDGAQPEQEPSYWIGYGLQAHTEKPFEGATPVYTTPPQRTWVGLTDDEVIQIRDDMTLDIRSHVDFYRHCEAKLKAKNERKEKNT